MSKVCGMFWEWECYAEVRDNDEDAGGLKRIARGRSSESLGRVYGL